MYLEILSYIEHKSARLRDLEEIFFLNARAATDTADKRESLFNKYAKIYVENWPDDVFFACDSDSKRTLGYLIGCRDSRRATDIFSPLLNSYTLFSDQFKKYPAHLHMNTHPHFHGKGAGTFLVQEYLLELKKAGVRGAHIVTSVDERNVNFYNKNKFSFRVEREYHSRKLLFMGQSL